MTYVFDIDGTICTNTHGEYSEAQPFMKRIETINELYDKGNTIVFLTARGMGRTKNCRETAYALFYDITKGQLKQWGVRYHELYLGKPSGDIYVDDKGERDENFFNTRD